MLKPFISIANDRFNEALIVVVSFQKGFLGSFHFGFCFVEIQKLSEND